MSFLKSFFIVLASMFVSSILGLVIPFIIAQFDNNPAWSFVPFYTIPLGLLIGLIIGLVIVFV